MELIAFNRKSIDSSDFPLERKLFHTKTHSHTEAKLTKNFIDTINLNMFCVEPKCVRFVVVAVAIAVKGKFSLF